MARLMRIELILLKCILLYLSGCLCQRDCTGVDCPLLENCIEEVLERGTCCASCMQKGCTCEGYQYYDCINAGFKNGKVPEGDSYFVDYGSTECACPEGGGRISCHFISCPDLPPNCIQVSEPADGCRQCESVGCIHGGQKYEGGHTFHIDRCQVCHCPNEGGTLMCYTVPDCDPHKTHKAMLSALPDVDTASRHNSDPYRFQQQGPTEHSSTPYHLSPSGNLPLFKSSPLEKDDLEDYDYGPTELPETYYDSLSFSTESSSSSKVISELRDSEVPHRTSKILNFERGPKLELRERYGVHDHPTNREITERPLIVDQSMEATSSLQPSEGLTSGQNALFNPETDFQNPLHTRSSQDDVIFPLKGVGSEEPQEHPQRIAEYPIHHQTSFEDGIHSHSTSKSVTHGNLDNHTSVHYPVRGTISEDNQLRGSDVVNFTMYRERDQETSLHSEGTSNGQAQLEGTVASDYYRGLDEEGGESNIVSFQSVNEVEEKDVPDNVKSMQQERSHNDSNISNPTPYERTTAEPSTSYPSMQEYQTTPTVHFSTKSQSTIRADIDHSQPIEMPDQLFNHPSDGHDERQTEVPEGHNEEWPFMLPTSGGKS
ncbi:uncharacterized protein LOC117507820 [Thalassophryne amazonica]|uniref:uncharacterized protein LOC117507820 n=1 Tax=Thalassophryne amazonica TaxID=390379 RepID=UPI001470F7AF|nr:uncharacterized protein LOC117507820 [Thalassophryne amazonica]